MRERVAMLGGTLTAGPRAEGGFAVVTELPYGDLNGPPDGPPAEPPTGPGHRTAEHRTTEHPATEHQTAEQRTEPRTEVPGA
jgi:hypothetical protein